MRQRPQAGAQGAVRGVCTSACAASALACALSRSCVQRGLLPTLKKPNETNQARSTTLRATRSSPSVLRARLALRMESRVGTLQREAEGVGMNPSWDRES